MNWKIFKLVKTRHKKIRKFYYFLFVVSFLFPYQLNAQSPLLHSFHEFSSLSTQVPLPFELSFHPKYRNLIFKKDYKFLSSNFNLKVNFSDSVLDSYYSPSLSNNRELVFLRPVSPFAWKTTNFTIEQTKENLIYFGSIVTQISLNEGNHTILELYSLQLGVGYKLVNSRWFGSLAAGVKLGVQQVYDFISNDRNKRFDFKYKSSFFTPSLFLNGKGFIIEGLVRLPAHEIQDHEVLIRPEYFGRFGLYWNLPDKIQP